MSRRDAPAVTCVLIFLDGAHFIDEAIRSVVAQGDDVDWELILVDDGSTDESTAIARRWAAADPRIRYLEHDGHANRGMSASRNAGVAAARGELIGFLDCDDVWLPSALAHGLRVLRPPPRRRRRDRRHVALARLDRRSCRRGTGSPDEPPGRVRCTR